MSQQSSDLAIVLSRTNFGERDRILTLLCKEKGKIRVLAKGVRSAKSKLAGGIELFSNTQISFVEGKTGLHILTSSRLEKHFGNIAQDLDKTMLAYEFLKTINKLVEDGSGQEYYQILSAVLAGLNDKEMPKDVVQLWFDVQVLFHSGSLPNLRTDAGGKALVESSSYQFDYDAQCFMVKENGPFTTDHIKLLRLCETHPKPPKLSVEGGLTSQTAVLAHNSLLSNVLNR